MIRMLLAWFGLPALVLAGCLVSPATSLAQAPNYPDRPVRLLVPLAAASAVDVVARLVSEKISDSLGQRFYVENQPGAAGLLGMRAGARAAADGYTVVVANDSVITMLPNMKADAGYDPLKDFLPVTQLVGIPLGLIAHPTLPAANVNELIALARQKPGGINYASGGIGSPQHVAMELLVRAAGVEMTHVPYRGATAAVNDIVAGHVPVGFTGMSSVVPLLADKRVRLLATSTSSRASQLSERSDRSRNGSRFQLRALVRAAGARAHAAGDCRPAQHRRRHSPEGSSRTGAAGRARIRGGRRHAGATGRGHARGIRAHGRTDP